MAKEKIPAANPSAATSTPNTAMDFMRIDLFLCGGARGGAPAKTWNPDCI